MGSFEALGAGTAAAAAAADDVPQPGVLTWQSSA